MRTFKDFYLWHLQGSCGEELKWCIIDLLTGNSTEDHSETLRQLQRERRIERFVEDFKKLHEGALRLRELDKRRTWERTRHDE